MTHAGKRILDDLSSCYAPQEYPALLAQYSEWSVTRPLAGMRLLDATPVYRNTCLKYAALLAAGASLDVARPSLMPCDRAVLGRLPDYGIRVVDPALLSDAYDVVLDCGGLLSGVPSRRGYVELTKSGEAAYRNALLPVFVVDRGLIKTIETSLGTGESFFRALDRQGYAAAPGAVLAVIGCGKVGRGIVLYALERALSVSVIDVERPCLPEHVGFVPATDREAVNDLLGQAWCAVTATGVRDAMAGIADAARLAPNPVLLANMGVEDEWGPDFPSARILNAKRPLNFILDDPTRLCFIDPAMALHNACAAALLSAPPPPGPHAPPRDLEERILALVQQAGAIPPALLDRLPAWG